MAKPKTSKPANSTGIALITGASRGIEAELAKQFAQGGYDVVLVESRANRGQPLSSLLHARIPLLEGRPKFLVQCFGSHL